MRKQAEDWANSTYEDGYADFHRAKHWAEDRYDEALRWANRIYDEKHGQRNYRFTVEDEFGPQTPPWEPLPYEPPPKSEPPPSSTREASTRHIKAVWAAGVLQQIHRASGLQVHFHGAQVGPDHDKLSKLMAMSDRSTYPAEATAFFDKAEAIANRYPRIDGPVSVYTSNPATGHQHLFDSPHILAAMQQVSNMAAGFQPPTTVMLRPKS